LLKSIQLLAWLGAAEDFEAEISIGVRPGML
jgi:hypothetical protein